MTPVDPNFPGLKKDRRITIKKPNYSIKTLKVKDWKIYNPIFEDSIHCLLYQVITHFSVILFQGGVMFVARRGQTSNYDQI